MATRIEPALVALRLAPGPLFLRALERVWEARDAVLPLDPTLPSAALRRLVDELRPARIVDPDGEVALPGTLPLEVGVAAVLATSGSTGRPKGVVLGRAALEASARASLQRLGAGSGDRWLCCLPLHHVAGLAVLVRSRLMGTPAVVLPRFSVEAVAEQRTATLLSLVPTMLARLLDAGVELGRFRAILLGGGPAPASLLERAADGGARVVVTYGMTETAGGCVYDGLPLDRVQVAVGPDRLIAVRGPVLFSGYRPAAGDPLDADGWFRTTDLGAWTPDGRLLVLGRADDVIVTGGEKVSAGEVAALLRGHPAVADAAVAGRSDQVWGQRVVAFVVPTDPDRPVTLDQLRRHVCDRAAPAQAPRELVLVDRLERSALGKPLAPVDAPSPSTP